MAHSISRIARALSARFSSRARRALFAINWTTELLFRSPFNGSGSIFFLRPPLPLFSSLCARVCFLSTYTRGVVCLRPRYIFLFFPFPSFFLLLFACFPPLPRLEGAGGGHSRRNFAQDQPSKHRERNLLSFIVRATGHSLRISLCSPRPFFPLFFALFSTPTPALPSRRSGSFRVTTWIFRAGQNA